MLSVMSDEKPNPLDDVRKGLGLLFRAAKTAADAANNWRRRIIDSSPPPNRD